MVPQKKPMSMPRKSINLVDDDQASLRPSEKNRIRWRRDRANFFSKQTAAYKKRMLKYRAGVSEPLNILAEGDSWFSYPAPGFGGGIIRRLMRKITVPILNMAEPGDEIRYIVGVKQREEMIKRLTEGPDGKIGGRRWDILLFSGGGNDIVDDPLALWLREYDSKK